MNKVIVACIDDINMAAYLAALSNNHPYKLIFIDDLYQIYSIPKKSALIVDLRRGFDNIYKLKIIKKIALCNVIGYYESLSDRKKFYYNKKDFDIIFKRIDLMRNLNSILSQCLNDDRI